MHHDQFLECDVNFFVVCDVSQWKQEGTRPYNQVEWCGENDPLNDSIAPSLRSARGLFTHPRPLQDLQQVERISITSYQHLGPTMSESKYGSLSPKEATKETIRVGVEHLHAPFYLTFVKSVGVESLNATFLE